MARTLKSDKTLFLLTLLLVGGGLVMVFSASHARAVAEGRSEYYFLIRQFIWAVIGFTAMWCAMRLDYRHYRRPEVVWGLVVLAVGLLLAVLVVGPSIKGTRRWFSLGFVNFQPSELAKIAAVIFTAALLHRRMHRMRDVAGTLGPIAVGVGALVVLILSGKDLGTAAVIVGAVLTMVFAAGISYRHLGVALVPITVGGAGLIWMEPYRFERLLTFLDPWKYANDEGYQVVQSMLAIASGGLMGQGFMGSRQKLLYLPEPHTDFIFSVAAEEFGLVGTTLLVLAFATLVWRGLRIAMLAPDRFGSFLALGITMVIAIQGLINISVAMSLLPTKGIALPFISNGGSSLLMSMIGMGILLNVSQHTSGALHEPAKTGSSWALGPSGGVRA